MRDIYLITMNEIRVTIRNPFWAFSGLFQPIIYLLLFGPLLNGIAGVRGFPGGGNAIQFFAPGLLIMNALFGSGFEGFTLRDKLDSGFLERLRVTPISRLSLALGFILQTSVNLVVQSILLVVALFFGLKFDPLGALVLLVLIVLIAITMASVSYRLGLMIREGGILAGIVNTFVLPAMILSGIMLPISFGPPIIQMAARLDPFYYAVNASRVLIDGHIGDPSVASALAIFAALAALCLGIFIRGMREAVA
jgi:ABC-2 type transport system permease protein